MFRDKKEMNADKSRLVALEVVDQLVRDLEASIDDAVVDCCCCRCCRCKTNSIGDLYEMKEELFRLYEARVPEGPAKRAVIEEKRLSIEGKLTGKSSELEAACDCTSAGWKAIARCCRAITRCCRRDKSRKKKRAETKSEKSKSEKEVRKKLEAEGGVEMEGFKKTDGAEKTAASNKKEKI